MRRAIVHIGLPRTGTTSLQHVFTRLRPDLLRAGILYPALTPASASEPHLSHQHLGEALDGRRPRSERSELLENLRQQLIARDAHTVLISYEHLCLVPPRRGVAGLLAGFFAQHGFAMEVLATIKPQAEFLNSTYTWRMQFLREHRSFTDFAAAETGARGLNYDALFEPWRTAAEGRLTVVALRDPRSADGLLLRFLEAAGLGAARDLVTDADLARVENRSPGPVAVEVCRRLSMHGARRRLGQQSRTVTRVVEDICRERGLDAVSFKGVDPTLRARIDARFAAANARLAAVAWAEPWTARVAAAPDLGVNELAHTGDLAAMREADAIQQIVCDRFDLPRRAGLPGLDPLLRLFGRGGNAHASR